MLAVEPRSDLGARPDVDYLVAGDGTDWGPRRPFRMLGGACHVKSARLPLSALSSARIAFPGRDDWEPCHQFRICREARTGRRGARSTRLPSPRAWACCFT